MRILGLPQWWRISSATNTTRLGIRFASKSTLSPKFTVDAVPQKTCGAKSPTSASPEPPRTRDELPQDGKVEKKKRVPVTTEEARKFVEMYDKGASYRDMQSDMPGRNYHFIKSLAWRYKRGALDGLLRGEGKAKRCPWTIEEKASMLELLDASVPPEVLLSSFPGRTAHAIMTMAYTPRSDPSWHGSLKARHWTPAEAALLEKSVAQGHSARDLTRTLNRTQSSIQKKAHKLGLSFRRDQWTSQEEEDAIRWRAGGVQLAQIAARLGGRSVGSVGDKMLSIAPGRQMATPLRLSPADGQEVEGMINENKTWDTIQQQKFPSRTTHALQSAYRKYKRGLLDRSQRLLTITTADEREIESLREQKKSWTQIRDLKYPMWSE